MFMLVDLQRLVKSMWAGREKGARMGPVDGLVDTGVNKRCGGDGSLRRYGNQTKISACKDARVYNGCPVSCFQQQGHFVEW